MSQMSWVVSCTTTLIFSPSYFILSFIAQNWKLKEVRQLDQDHTVTETQVFLPPALPPKC